jgi:dienelactone hydrolase
VAKSKQRIDVAKAPVVYSIPGMERVAVRRGVAYRAVGDTTLAMDVTYPPDAAEGARLPAIVFVLGYTDARAIEMFGVKLKDMQSYVCWGQLAAASGLVAVTYETAQPASDIHGVLAYLRGHAGALGIDGERIGLWACSGNVPVALAALMREPVRCAVAYYGYMLDWPGSDIVSKDAQRIGFANPCGTDAFDALPRDIPLLIVRAERDGRRLNQTIDRFVHEARARSLPLTLVDYAEGRHAFDIVDDTERSREIIQQTLASMRSCLVKGETRGPR